MISLSTLVLSFLILYWYERPLRFRIGHNVPAKWVVFAGCGATVVALALVSGVGAWAHRAPRTAGGNRPLCRQGRLRSEMPAHGGVE